MPAYINSPFQTPKLVMKGVPCYLLGSFNYQAASSNLALQSVAVSSNVATVAALLLNGPAPVVGGLISITNSVSSSGVFNVSRAVITNVVVNNSTGVCTITFGLTASNFANTDSGSVICEPNEVGETMVAGASMPCVIQAPDSDSQFTVDTAVTFSGALPTAVTVTLQKALRNVDSEFTNVGNAAVIASSAYTTGPVAQFTLERGYVYRFNVSGITGTGNIIAKIGG